jgi:hypothetical protein
MKLPIDRIRQDRELMAREAMNPQAVADYAECYLNGETLPPPVVFDDHGTYWLGDGNHRLAGAEQADLRELECEVRPGTRRDALLHAAGANAKHGLRRSDEDKRRAILILLDDPEWQLRSVRAIAEHCHVSQHLVRQVRASIGLPSTGNGQVIYKLPDGTMGTMRTENLGRGRRQAEASEANHDGGASRARAHCPAEASVTVRLPADVFRVGDVSSVKAGRFATNAVQVELLPDGTAGAVATDGISLLIASWKGDGDGDGPARTATIPAGVWQEASKLAKHGPVSLAIHADGTVSFQAAEQDGVKHAVESAECLGRFPSWRKVMGDGKTFADGSALLFNARRLVELLNALLGMTESPMLRLFLPGDDRAPVMVEIPPGRQDKGQVNAYGLIMPAGGKAA